MQDLYLWFLGITLPAAALILVGIWLKFRWGLATKMFFAAIPLSISATIINSLLMVAVLWSVMAHDRLGLLGAAMLLVMLYRAVVAGWFARDSGRFTMQYWGKLFSPGKIPFHMPEMIVKPPLDSWWNKGSIEAWYQNNKVMQIYE